MSQTPVDVSMGPSPVQISARIGSLDLLRGVAVLGILVMNIQAFSMPDPAYFNPTVYGDLTGVNLAVWWVSHVLTEMKFMSIFSMLFGAGVVLLCQRLEQSNLPSRGVYYRRTLWLLVFGVLHAYLLWTGDILVWYALSGLIAYLFWRVRPGWLVFWSLLLLFVGTGLYLFFQWSLPYWPEDAVQNNLAWWEPGAKMIQERLAAYRGNWIGQMSERVPTSIMLQTFVYLIFGLWRTLGMMLAGMALVKWGVLSAQRSRRFYVVTIIVGLAIGWPLSIYGASQNFTHNWSQDYSMFGGTLFNYWGSAAVAMAYVSLVMIWWRSSVAEPLKRVLGAVGRMAFSNYILETIICTTMFYGHGFGLFGMVPRWAQLCIVVAIWIILVCWSHSWLKRFRFGPLEWLWRGLTYKRRQPMRRALAKQVGFRNQARSA
jgi:uncharacterized protein